MFENFVLGSHSQTANASRLPEEPPSPTDCSFPAVQQAHSINRFTTLQEGGINHYVQQLSLEEHDLPLDTRWRQDNVPSLDINHDTAEDLMPEDFSYLSMTRGVVTIPHHPTRSLPTLPSIPSRAGNVACRRLQRQLNVQLQSSNKHKQEISTLVEDMITTNSQCTLHHTTPKAYPNPPSYPLDGSQEPSVAPYEDEGFVDMDDDEFLALDEDMTLRRATPSGIRKNPTSIVRWRKSADCVTAVDLRGRPKIRSVPRMRKRW